MKREGGREFGRGRSAEIPEADYYAFVYLKGNNCVISRAGTINQNFC